MDISVHSDTYVADDMSWLGSAHGTDATETITLDVSAFTEGTHYPNGVLLAGLPLGKITATGKYGPYGASPSEVQTVTVDATGGTFTISFDGATTAAIAANETAANVQAALELLSTINSGDVTVTRSGSVNAYVYTLTFGGRYLGLNVPAVTTNAASLTGGAGTATVATSTAGGGTASDGTETLAGFLYHGVKVPDTTDTTIDAAGALLTHGKVRSANLPVSVDAAGQADVAGRIRFI